MMEHTHNPKTIRKLLSDTLYECSCGARKWSNGRGFESESGTYKIENGWYIYTPNQTREEIARLRAIEMIQTEGHGYGRDTRDWLDSHVPNID